MVENLPALYQDYDFAGMVRNSYNDGFVKYCEDKYTHREYLDGKQSIIMCGNIGTGKTRLAVATAKNMQPAYQSAVIKFYQGFRATKTLFIMADIMFDQLNQKTRQDGKEKYFHDMFAKYDLIILDELSVQNFTDAKEENLFLFISHTYVYKHPVIVTMNFGMERLKTVSPRTEDRLREAAVIMEHKGISFRK